MNHAAQTITLRHECVLGVFEAAVETIGAKQRGFSLNGRQAMQQYHTTNAGAPLATGWIMAPWANRITHGRWALGAQPQQLLITDTAHDAALHGLVMHTNFEVLFRLPNTVTLGAKILPTAGYPFEIDLEVSYRLDDNGLAVTHTATNRSRNSAPFATGAHPYFSIEGEPTEALVFQVPASRRVVTGKLLEPIGEAMHSPAQWLNAAIPTDTPFSSLQREASGLAITRLRASSGAEIQIWQEPAFSSVHIYSTDSYPGLNGPTNAIAIEPVTCGPDVFNNSAEVIWLSTDTPWSASWGARLLNW